MKTLHKYHCSGCEYNFPVTDEIIKKCYDCGSSLIKEDKNLTPDDYLEFIESELESANLHNSIELPRKLYEKLSQFVEVGEEDLELAKSICETFYDNI